MHSLILIRNLSSSCRLGNLGLSGADPHRAHLECLQQVSGEELGRTQLLVVGKPGDAEPRIRAEQEGDDECYG